MTAYLSLLLIKELQIDPKNLYCRVSKSAATVGGTCAVLREGQRLSVYDLLFGLMLPSGNDAAMVLAEHFGRYLILEKSKTNY
jgi:serine-type D-Ala-D-Ala carboxypeptidase (penicillin-binding protein 5/6)